MAKVEGSQEDSALTQLPAADQTLARYINERRILTLLRVQGAMSRAEAARELGLTRATVTKLVEGLCNRGLVTELQNTSDTGPRRVPGRPGVDIMLDPEGGYFLGAEIGVGVLRFALLDFALGVVDSVTSPTAQSISPAEVIDTISRHVKSLERRKKYKGRLRALGITVPGLVRSDGFVVHLPILGWKEVNVRALAESVLHLPTFIENNANAAAFGEAYTQPTVGQDSLIYLKCGTGCGGAAIINGRLLHGGSGTAGEFGHIRVATAGPTCSCGQVGCLETFVSIAALRRAYSGKAPSSVDGLSSLPAAVASLAEQGDAAARTAIQSICEHLAIGLISLTNLFNPSTIVLGGAMRPALAFCLNSLREEVAARIVPGMKTPEIRLSTLGELECAIGAATITHHWACDVSNFEIAKIA